MNHSFREMRAALHITTYVEHGKWDDFLWFMDARSGTFTEKKCPKGLEDLVRIVRLTTADFCAWRTSKAYQEGRDKPV